MYVKRSVVESLGMYALQVPVGALGSAASWGTDVPLYTLKFGRVRAACACEMISIAMIDFFAHHEQFAHHKNSAKAQMCRCTP